MVSPRRCSRCEAVLSSRGGTLSTEGLLLCDRCALAARIDEGPTLAELARQEDTKVGLGLIGLGLVLLLGGGYLLSVYVEGQRAMQALGTSSRVAGRGLVYALVALGFGAAALGGGVRKLWRRGRLE